MYTDAVCHLSLMLLWAADERMETVRTQSNSKDCRSQRHGLSSSPSGRITSWSLTKEQKWKTSLQMSKNHSHPSVKTCSRIFASTLKDLPLVALISMSHRNFSKKVTSVISLSCSECTSPVKPYWGHGACKASDKVSYPKSSTHSCSAWQCLSSKEANQMPYLCQAFRTDITIVNHWNIQK